MSILITILFFVLGLLIGSFLNVVILRSKKQESVVSKPSHCPKCKKRLKVWDLIPVLSFLLLQKRCRYCKKEISWQYPLVEISTALIFAALYLECDLTLRLGYFLVIAGFLMVILVFDLKYYLILDRIVLPAALLAFLGSYLILEISLVKILMGGLIGASFFLILFLITKGKGMGLGDVKLGLFGGFFFGWPAILIVLFLTFLLGGLISALLLLMKKKKRTDMIPFAPFFVVSFFAVMFFGNSILDFINRLVF